MIPPTIISLTVRSPSNYWSDISLMIISPLLLLISPSYPQDHSLHPYIIILVGGLEPWNFMTFHLLGISSSLLTISYFSEGQGSTTNQYFPVIIYILMVFSTINHPYHPFIDGGRYTTNQISLIPKLRCFKLDASHGMIFQMTPWLWLIGMKKPMWQTNRAPKITMGCRNHLQICQMLPSGKLTQLWKITIFNG